MNRMTVTIDPELLTEAKEALGAPTKAATIQIALTEVVRKQHLAAALKRRGRVDLELDQRALEKQRQDP